METLKNTVKNLIDIRILFAKDERIAVCTLRHQKLDKSQVIIAMGTNDEVRKLLKTPVVSDSKIDELKNDAVGKIEQLAKQVFGQIDLDEQIRTHSLVCDPEISKTPDIEFEFAKQHAIDYIFKNNDLNCMMFTLLPSPEDGGTVVNMANMNPKYGDFIKDVYAEAIQALGDMHNYIGWCVSSTGWAATAPKDQLDKDNLPDEFVHVSKNPNRKEVLIVMASELNGQQWSYIATIKRDNSDLTLKEEQRKVLSIGGPNKEDEYTLVTGQNGKDVGGRFSFEYGWKGSKDYKPVVTA